MLLEIDLNARLRTLTFDGEDDAISELGMPHPCAQFHAGGHLLAQVAARRRSAAADARRRDGRPRALRRRARDPISA